MTKTTNPMQPEWAKDGLSINESRMQPQTTIPPVSNGEAWIEFTDGANFKHTDAEQIAFDAGWEAGLKAAKWARDFEKEQYRVSCNET